MERPYDIIVWGASGFTGQLVVDYMSERQANSNLRWAVAGRNINKLEQVLEGRNIPVLEAESHDTESLNQLVQQGRVILTTVGPYARYGSELVAACVRHGTHYCDLTGEVHWMREMISKHQLEAINSGAKIVHTCGFDSIPSDIGVFYLQKQMKERHDVVANRIKYRVKGFSGGFSGGTMDSMMSMMEKAKEDPSIFKIMADPYSLNDKDIGQDGPDRVAAYFDEDFDSWVGPFVMAAINTRVVRRTNELLKSAYGSDFQYDEGTLSGKGATGFLGATGVGIGTGAFAGLASFSPTRSLLKRVLPKPGEGPSKESMDKGFFEIDLLGIHSNDISKNIKVRVKGDKDPGYGSTSKMIAESALALAQDDLNVGGCFWTPASAMGEALLTRLPEGAGVTFEVVED
ncbi:MAG: saccharopine dehydrogenase NADP-binding domain-containing protein [Pseudomonadota bacterium]|nr:saccharopine dehydrogenase NADP-binding domain-containing protein [Pseudomonadota bacterium]